MQAEKTVKTWEKTRLQNLVRHKSGRYYARLFLNGKEIWKALKTSHFSVAEARLAVVLKEHRERKGKEIDASNAKMTFGEAASLHMQRVADDVSIKRRTRQYWKETLDALARLYPFLRAGFPRACKCFSHSGREFLNITFCTPTCKKPFRKPFSSRERLQKWIKSSLVPIRIILRHGRRSSRRRSRACPGSWRLSCTSA